VDVTSPGGGDVRAARWAAWVPEGLVEAGGCISRGSRAPHIALTWSHSEADVHGLPRNERFFILVFGIINHVACCS
jgi:hypothetical protein